MITVVSSVIEGERNFLMIIMGGYSDDLSDHCVFGLIFLQNWLTQFTQIWVLSQAKMIIIKLPLFWKTEQIPKMATILTQNNNFF